jgi:hypothetical protein
MGFIEELRRESEQNRLREQTKKEAGLNKIKIQEERKNQQQLKQAREIEKIHLKSIEYVNKSDFPRLAKDLADVIHGNLCGPSNFYRVSDYYKYSDERAIPEGVELEVAWDYKSEEHNSFVTTQYKYVKIRFYPNGNIQVKGGLFGSTNLSLEQWHKHPDIQEGKLEKAFKSPGMQSESYYSSTDNYPSGYQHDGM